MWGKTLPAPEAYYRPQRIAELRRRLDRFEFWRAAFFQAGWWPISFLVVWLTCMGNAFACDWPPAALGAFVVVGLVVPGALLLWEVLWRNLAVGYCLELENLTQDHESRYGARSEPVTTAIDVAANGFVGTGFRELHYGEGRARVFVEEGETWAPELVKRYRQAVDNFTGEYGAKLVE